MARYDRIAPLNAPTRASTFPAWCTLRDLEDRERDAELMRRARLRFLALRPVRRLLAQGLDAVPAPSLERQIEGVREELGHLPARDTERARLAAFLHDIRQRTPSQVVSATLVMGEEIESAEHFHAAEEYYRTALELAESHRLVPEQVTALRLLGRVATRTARPAEARLSYGRAGELALQARDRPQWARAREGLAAVCLAEGAAGEAREVLEEVQRRGEEWDDDVVCGTAAASLCGLERTQGGWEEALRQGWSAMQRVGEGLERHAVLVHMAAAFVRLALYDAAASCLELAIAAADGAERDHARAEHALLAAEARDAGAFRARRQALIAEAAEWSTTPRLLADVHLLLGRGCMLVGDADHARDHLREALAAGKRHGYAQVRTAAEQLLSALEARNAEALRTGGVARASAAARRIAREVVASAAEVAAGG